MGQMTAEQRAIAWQVMSPQSSHVGPVVKDANQTGVEQYLWEHGLVLTGDGEVVLIEDSEFADATAVPGRGV